MFRLRKSGLDLLLVIQDGKPPLFFVILLFFANDTSMVNPFSPLRLKHVEFKNEPWPMVPRARMEE